MRNFVTSPIVLAIVLACMSIGAQAALTAEMTEWLVWYDDMALYNIWRLMMWTVYYQFLPAYVCANYGTFLAVNSGLFEEDDV